MKTLRCACGTRFKVDADVWAWGRHEKWCLKNGYPTHWVKTTRKGAGDGYQSYLHRELLEFPIGFVHHVNDDPLDCRRANLQVLSPAEHQAIHGQGERAFSGACIRPARSASGYKGVVWHKNQGKWYAQISVDGKNTGMGYHDTAEEAAIVYDAAVLHYRAGKGYRNLV